MVRKVWVTIASLPSAQQNGLTVEKNRERVYELLDEAGYHCPDLIVLPENVGLVGLPSEIHSSMDVAEPDDGPLCQIAREKARQFNTYIILPIRELDRDKVYNTAILLNRRGEIVGKYRKVYITRREAERGIVPGRDAPIFETDFGRIGILICFDVYFPKLAADMAKKGAEVLCFCSAFEAGLGMLQPMALLNRCYVVSSTSATYSYIIDPIGEVIHQKSRFIATSCINLDYVVCCASSWQIPRVKQAKKKYNRGIQIKELGGRGIFLMTSETEAVTLKDIIEEFQIETLDQHLEISLRKIRESLEKNQ